MKVTKRKEVVLSISEFKAVLRHFKQLGILIREFERLDRTGKLAGSWKSRWKSLKKFLLSEELPGSEDDNPKKIDGRYCCKLYTRDGRLMKCTNYNAWYSVAWSGCVGLALLGGYDAQLISGRCRNNSQCARLYS